MDKIRAFFKERQFLEVETPYLLPSPDPTPNIEPFQTYFENPDGSKKKLYLSTSPEFAMKRLIARGYEKIFQICKFFRNGEVSDLHNPEFTGLEFYFTPGDYRSLMEVVEELFLYLWGKEEFVYSGRKVDLRRPWKRYTVEEAFREFAGIEIKFPISLEELRSLCEKNGLITSESDRWEDLFFKLFLTYVEPNFPIDRPVFIYDYPAELAALARKKPENPALAERVELYIAGLELGNGYSELTDPDEQLERWERERLEREELGRPLENVPDRGLIEALRWGMPPTAGIALGVDRMLMLYLNAEKLSEVLAFPFEEYL